MIDTMQLKKNIGLVLVWLGEWPVWFDVFLRSCEFNPNIDWLIFSDNHSTLKYKPANIYLHQTSLEEIIQRIENKIQRPTINNPIKFCDYKVMYGHVFEEYLNKYQYWGHCDLDIVWGNVEGFLNKINYQQYDLISSRDKI